ncbi:MAG TPA: cation diffusion facilitator family transporter [Rhodocyclaceae bacterium]|nr:cation diffusion facilitator family transporter [Rhodocyclaceae bacterium]
MASKIPAPRTVEVLALQRELYASSHEAGKSASAGAVVAALAANVSIALAKFAGAVYTGSGALLAEALHSLADTGNQGLLLWGMRQSKTPASVDFPLGHGRALYFWSFIVALMLFSMGGLLSIYEGIHKLGGHSGIQSPAVALAILVFALGAEGYSLSIALRRINRLRRGKPLWRWFIDTRRSELMVVLGEDSAAMLGLCLAGAAVVLTMVTGNPAYDALGSILVGTLLVLVAIALGYEIKGLLIGQSAAPDVRRAILDVLHSQQQVARVVDLITLQQGDDIFVAARVVLGRAESADQVTEDIRRCKQALQAAVPTIAWVFLEPQAR